MTWTDVDRVARALGDPAAAADEYLADCVAAADDWARRKRLEAGYVDTDPPAAAVAQGTTLYAVALYRERGSSDSFASFEDLSAFGATGTMGQIKRLLGIGRAAVDRAPTDADVVALGGRRRRWPLAPITIAGTTPVAIVNEDDAP